MTFVCPQKCMVFHSKIFGRLIKPESESCHGASTQRPFLLPHMRKPYKSTTRTKPFQTSCFSFSPYTLPEAPVSGVYVGTVYDVLRRLFMTMDDSERGLDTENRAEG